MIKVDNSPMRRVFTDEDHDDVRRLKKRVVDMIERIENNGTFDYSLLDTLSTEAGNEHLSVFQYKKAIEASLNVIDQGYSEIIQENIYLILVGRFDKLKEFINANQVNLTYLQCDKKYTHSYGLYKEAFEKLYKDYLSQNDKFKESFFKMFDDINVCPYCNRNFINPIYKELKDGCDNIKQSPDIEHFFPKSLYPFLSLSVSNLLPSCSFCNKIKSNVDPLNGPIQMRSPYEITHDDFEFEFELVSDKIHKIKLKSNYKNSKILHLESLYSNIHAQYINDIYFDILKQPKALEDSIKNLFIARDIDFQKYYKKIFRNYSEEKDFNRSPLAKLTKDLYEHVKIMNRT